jgi:uncharacterized protein YkwD
MTPINFRRRHDAGGSRAARLAGGLAVLLAAILSGCVQVYAPDSSAHGAAGFGQVVPLDDPDRALLAAAIFAQTNRARAASGLEALGRLPELDAAADEQVLHMALLLRTEHSNPIPGEQTPADRVARTGFRASRVAENAIMLPARPPAGSAQPPYTYSGLAAALVQNWMDSPGHRLNILDREITYLGCAARFAHGGRGEPFVFATQVFALPAGGGTGQR